MRSPETIEQSSVEPSEEQLADVTSTIHEISAIDEEISAAEDAAAERRIRLYGSREDIGVPPPASEIENERISRLKAKRASLENKQKEWTRRFGSKNLPPGIALDANGGDRLAKGDSSDCDNPSAIKEKRDHLESRNDWVRDLTKRAIGHFEQAMRTDWQTRGCLNLETAIRLMKIRVPHLIEYKANEFLRGKTDDPGFASVWIRWHTDSPLSTMMRQRNQVRNIELVFDEEPEKLANDNDLKDVDSPEKDVAERPR